MDRTRNDKIRGTIEVGKFPKKVQEQRLQWTFDKKSWRLDGEEGDDEGNESARRPKQKWMERVQNDLRENKLDGDEYKNWME